MAYISFGTHEGHYFGVYRDKDDRFVLTHRLYGGEQKTRTRDYFIGADGSLTLHSDNPTHGYDPRRRPWYIAASDNRRRTWSEPYVWYDIGVPGITRSEAIVGNNDKVLAVTTTDFHLNGLSEFVEGLSADEGERTLIFTAKLDVIAFPGEEQTFGQGGAEGADRQGHGPQGSGGARALRRRARRSTGTGSPSSRSASKKSPISPRSGPSSWTGTRSGTSPLSARPNRSPRRPRSTSATP